MNREPKTLQYWVDVFQGMEDEIVRVEATFELNNTIPLQPELSEELNIVFEGENAQAEYWGFLEEWPVTIQSHVMTSFTLKQKSQFTVEPKYVTISLVPKERG